MQNQPEQQTQQTHQATPGSVTMETIKTMAKNPVIVGVAVGGGLLVGTGVLIKITYDYLKKTQPFSREDLDKHSTLCRLYEEKLTVKPPADWNLDGKKPKHTYDFLEEGKKLKEIAEDLTKYHTKDHEARAVMLNHIADLFLSMSKRAVLKDIALHAEFHHVRLDGVEVMFFVELTKWLLESAPNLEALTSEKVREYKNRLAYCQAIEKRVITAEYTESGRNNPNITLTRLITHLRNYTKKLEELEQARNFNSLITELDNLTLGLNSRAIDFLYLLICGVPSNNFTLDKFLSPESVDKIKAVRETRLGNWLYQTLRVSGVRYLKYEPSHTLKLEAISTHLKDMHPDDPAFAGAPYSTVTNLWGSHPFAWAKNSHYQDGRQKEKKYLLKIRDLNRVVLELYYLSQTLSKASKASENFGDIWMYGNPAAKANAYEMLESIKEDVSSAYESFRVFWEDFYVSDFQEYAKKKVINLRDEVYRPLVHINETILPQMKQMLEKIKQKANDIKAKIDAFDENSPEIEISKIQFFERVIEYSDYRQRAGSANYVTAKKELVRLRQNLANMPILTSVVEEATPLRLPTESTIPRENVLGQALACLSLARENFVFTDKYADVPNIREDKFYSDFQRDVFNTIIKKYNGIVNNRATQDFLLGSLNYKKSSFNLLRYKYACLYEAFEALYFNTKCNQLTADELEQFKEKNSMAIDIFDQALHRFVADIEHLELLFREDSHTTHDNSVNGKYNALEIQKKKNGDFAVKPNHRYDELKKTVVLTPAESQSNNVLNETPEWRPSRYGFLSIVRALTRVSIFTRVQTKEPASFGYELSNSSRSGS